MLALLIALLCQTLPPCGSSSPYDEAWTVRSMLHTASLCREPAQARDQAAIWYWLQRGDELLWRGTFPWRFEHATVSSDGWTAACGPVDAGRLIQPVLAIDPLGETIVDHQTALAPQPFACTIAGRPEPGAAVQQLLVSDRAELLVVRRTDELWQRFSLRDGEELASVDMRARLREHGFDGYPLEAAAIEGRPFFVLHDLDEDSRGRLRSIYLVLDADLAEWRRIEVPRPEYDDPDRARDALRWAARRGEGTLRIDRASQLRIRRGDAWVDWALRDTPGGALALVELGLADPQPESDG